MRWEGSSAWNKNENNWNADQEISQGVCLWTQLEDSCTQKG